MTNSTKQKALLLIGIAALLLVVLAMSLPALQLRPGQLFSLPTLPQPEPGDSGLSDTNWVISLLRAVVAVALILLPVYLVYHLLNREHRRKLVADLAAIAMLFLLANWLAALRATAGSDAQPPAQGSVPEQIPLPSGEVVPPSFSAQPPAWLVVVMALVLALVIALAFFFWLRRRAAAGSILAESSGLDELADSAQTALTSLQTGASFTDVVIRCYAQMSQSLRSARGIERSQAMTTYEFEQELLARGLPAQPVHQLTQLFEQVRYGRQAAGEREKRLAQNSLREILDYCRGQA